MLVRRTLRTLPSAPTRERSKQMVFLHPRGFKFPEGGILKAIGAGSRFGAYAVRFSGPDQKDLSGEYFTSETDFGPRNGDGSPVLIHHGNPIEKGLEAFANVVLPAAEVKRDQTGLFASTKLDLEDPIQAAIGELIAEGHFRWSSGSAPQFVKRASDGQLLKWLPVEFSITPTPAEPRLPRIRPL
jgi:hypothetical protein